MCGRLHCSYSEKDSMAETETRKEGGIQGCDRAWLPQRPGQLREGLYVNQFTVTAVKS